MILHKQIQTFMMRILTIFLATLLSVASYAADNDKQFIKLIKKCDVPEVARCLASSEGTEQFWFNVLEDNPIIKNLLDDISKGKGCEKEALKAINRMKLFNYRLDVDIVDELKGFCDTLVMDMGLPHDLVEMNIIYDTSPNAFTVLTDNGFAICLNTGLCEKLGFDYERIMSVAAHEFAHGAFMHHLRKEYEAAKNDRRNKIIGGISVGLAAVSNLANAYTSGMLGTEYDSSEFSRQYNHIAADIKNDSYKFRYMYGREQELEADLVAFRFMQFLGCEKKYLEALQLITDSDMYFWSAEDSDHPSTAYRLEFLDFVAKNPQYKNEVKLHKEKKYSDKTYDPIYE